MNPVNELPPQGCAIDRQLLISQERPMEFAIESQPNGLLDIESM